MSWFDRLFRHPTADASQTNRDSSRDLKPAPDTGRKSENVLSPPDHFSIAMAFKDLFLPGATFDQRRRVLERHQDVLLTDQAIAALMEMAQDESDQNPLLVTHFLLHAELLDSARHVGIPEAWRVYLSKVSEGPVDDQLADAQGQWFRLAREPRDQRRFLEAHLELLSYGGLAQLQLFIAYAQQVAGTLTNLQRYEMRAMWNMMLAAHKLGGDVQAIQQIYVNQFGGFALDVPDWLAHLMEQDTALHSAGRVDQTARLRISLWQHAIDRARRESPGMRPEILAEMYVLLRRAYNEAQGLDKQQLQQQEIACLSLALQVYTRDRYPYPWALAQYNLGSSYHKPESGGSAEHQERAITCFQAALEVLTERDFPLDWARAQNNLGIVYRERIRGNREENQEQALLCYQAALRVFTQEDIPRDWAMIQANLGTLFLERLHGERVQNHKIAIAAFKDALRVFNEREFPVEWATTQNNLGNVLFLYQGGDAARNREQAIACYKAALRVRTEEHFPIEWATTQNNLGNLYSQYTGEDQAEYQEQAIMSYEASLRVFTERDFPTQWARSQYNMGQLYRNRLRGTSTENQKKAIACYEASLRVYTRQAFPDLHRSAERELASCAATYGMWELAANALASAREAENDLLALAAGVKEVDIVLSKNDELAAYEAFALTRLGNYAGACEAVERGQARGVATARLLSSADPQRIGDPRLREEYISHRTALLQAQAAIQQADPPLPTEERLARAQVLREARAGFDTMVETIRAAKDPADFLIDDFNAETLLHLVSQKAAAYGLIYLIATPWGGLALGALGARPAQGAPASFVALDLPMLTAEDLNRHIETDTRESTRRLLGSYAYAQEGNALKILVRDWEGMSFVSCAAHLHEFCREHQQYSTLDAAAQDIMHSAHLHEIVKKPWNALNNQEQAYLEMALNQRFLHYELEQSLEWLAEVALRPLADWLEQEGMTQITIIPCGLLAAFPLLAVPLKRNDNDMVTLADRYITSIAPNARALLHSPSIHSERSGVASLGNPYPSSQPLAWGEAEALTLAALGGDATRAAIQYEADRASLLEMLRTARVVDVSSHGVVAKNYLQSRLLLANDEYLTLADALNGEIAHGLRLLILSACQTAIPDLRGALSEVRSLAVGMLQAGAEAVLASLWPVDDKATYLLMVRFAQEWFPHMETELPAAALARAQRWLRTVSYRELQTWQATFPVFESPDFQHHPIVQSATIAPQEAHLASQPDASLHTLESEGQLITNASPRYSVQDAEQILQEVALRRAQVEHPGARPYAEPYYWAGFQLYGW